MSELDRLVAQLAEELPGQMEGLLDQPRFAEGRAALERLRAAEWRGEALRPLSEGEAAWLLEALRARWATIVPKEARPEAPVVVPSRAAVRVAIVAPAEVPANAGRVEVKLVVEGLEEPVRVSWEGASPSGPRSAVVSVPEGAARLTVGARVDGRREGVRVLEVVQIEVRVR